MMDWDGLRLLLEVERTGSFFRAGESLGLAPSTISRRLTALERSLGAQLLERASDGCRLTDQGKRAVALAQQTLRGLERLAYGVEGELHGSIVVTCGDGFVPIVMGVAAKFRQQHPGCVIDVSVGADFLKISRGEADIAIRTAHLGEPSLVYRRIGQMSYGYYAHPVLFESSSSPSSPQETPFITMSAPLDRLPPLQAAQRAGFVQVCCRVNTFAALLDAVHAGLGVTALPRATSAGLIEVFVDHALPSAELFIVTRASSSNQPHIQRFTEALKQACLDAEALALKVQA